MMRTIDVCPVEELPPGAVRIVRDGRPRVGVFNAGGELCAIEDGAPTTTGRSPRASSTRSACIVVCPRHGSEFDICTGRPRTLPAYLPVRPTGSGSRTGSSGSSFP